MKMISECFVKPKHEVEASKERMYLTPLEILFLGIEQVQKGLLFKLDPPISSTIIVDLLDNLKNSLSIALDHFYPLAGQFETETFPDEGACVVFIDCNKGPGARLMHVGATDLTVSDILSPARVPSVVGKLFDLGEEYLNYEGYTRPLLSIQVTELVDGDFIGFKVNHSVLDGTSFMHFLSVFSDLFDDNSIQISRVPVYGNVKPVKLPYLGLDGVVTWPINDPIVKRVFHVSSNAMATIKAKANQVVDPTGSNVSSFQGLVALIWRSITRARNLSADEETTCSLAVNARSRVEPPLPDGYFGNHVAQARVICKVSELLDHDLGWVAKCLNDGIRAHDSESIRGASSKIADLVTTPGFLSSIHSNLGSNMVVVGGSAWFDMYRSEFGLGKAVAVLTGFVNKYDGKVILTSQGRQGSGSADLEINLNEEYMIALENDPEFMSFIS